MADLITDFNYANYDPGDRRFPRRVIENNIIELHRGDSFQLPLFINAGDKFDFKRYLLRPGDKIYFSVAEPNQPWEHSLIKKIFTRRDFNEKGDIIIRLEPKDTEYVMPGKYFYEIKLVTKAGVATIYPKHQL